MASSPIPEEKPSGIQERDSDSQPSAAGPVLKPVPEEHRHRYGIRNMEVLATTTPIDLGLFDYAANTYQTFTAHKMISTVGNPDFSRVYEDKIHDKITKALSLLLPETSEWAVHVLRMGFTGSQKDHPIVLHVFIARDDLSDDSACVLVSKIADTISAAKWEGEPVYVDVCQRVASYPDFRAEDANSEGNDLSEMISEFYSYSPPLPGFSIGTITEPHRVGSFSGFIKHANTTYGLTCENVVNGTHHSVLPRSGPYKYEGGEKLIVMIPAAKDHEFTMDAISTKLKDAQDHPEHQKWAGGMLHEPHWSTAKQRSEKYDTEAGHIYATSGLDKSQQFYPGSLDWAIFCCSFGDVKNKHPKYCAFDSGSGFRLKYEVSRYVNSQLGPEFVDRTEDYFLEGPDFKPPREALPEEDEIFFKIPSRSYGWKEAKYNGIRATLNRDGKGVTRELCFVNHSFSSGISMTGDSGAPLIDSTYRPTAISWVGSPFHDSTFKDVTYATPIHVILRDIERRSGWEVGSASFC